MAKVLCNVQWKSGTPTVQEICDEFQVDESDFDGDFGVVAIDPRDNLFSVMVEESAVARIDPSWARVEGDRGTLEGPFSNPKIEPFGPPEA